MWRAAKRVIGVRVKDALARARAALRAAKYATPALDAEVLLAHVLACERVELYARPERELSAGQVQQYRELLGRRLKGEPVAYLTGRKEFMGLDFLVTPAVLIPRPETELLVETALELLGALETPLVADVGTGSGAVAVSIACRHPGAVVYALDIAEAALEVARANARRHRVADRLIFLAGDLLDALGRQLEGQFDLVCANLPYVPREELPYLPREVRYEPRVAVDGGPGGLELYRRLVPQAARFLKPGGRLLIEIDPRQSEAARSLLPAPVWNVKIVRDLAGRDRLVVAAITGRKSEAGPERQGKKQGPQASCGDGKPEAEERQ
ncbi:MAG: peptide chain release factor N(5)-glutamine methyltransferase [Bacillota bacterium]